MKKQRQISPGAPAPSVTGRRSGSDASGGGVRALRCTGAAFAFLVGDDRSPAEIVKSLLREREIDFEDGDEVRVSLRVVPKKHIPKRRLAIHLLGRDATGSVPTLCPKCGAKPGEPCRTPIGDVTRIHASRLNIGRANAVQPEPGPAAPTEQPPEEGFLKSPPTPTSREGR